MQQTFPRSSEAKEGNQIRMGEVAIEQYCSASLDYVCEEELLYREWTLPLGGKNTQHWILSEKK